MFPINKTAEWYLQKPLDYLAYLLENKGDRSITHFLRRNFYGTGISIQRVSISNFELFSVNFHLTQSGVLNFNEILTVFFSYMTDIRAEGINTSIYKSLQDISVIKYLHGEPEFETPL